MKSRWIVPVSLPPRVFTLLRASLIIFTCLVLNASAINTPGQALQKNSPLEPAVIRLVAALADQAQFSSDISFAASAEARAALLIWNHDREKSRAIFRRTIGQLSHSLAAHGSLSAAESEERKEMRAGLLYRIAALDPELGEELARELVTTIRITNRAGAGGPAQLSSAITDGDGNGAVNRELLVGMAMRMADLDACRAVTLARWSLEGGVSPYLDRLLLSISESDPALADQLFSSALAYLEGHKGASLGEIHTLGFYLMSSIGVRGRGAMTDRYLNLVLNRLHGDGGPVQTVDQRGANASSELQFIGRELAVLVPRYMPEREVAVHALFPVMDEPRTPSSGAVGSILPPQLPIKLELRAGNSPAGSDRDSLYTEAAFECLTRGDLSNALRATSKIEKGELRDRVVVQVARRLISMDRIEESAAALAMLGNPATRVSLQVRLAERSVSLGDSVRAANVLNEAATEVVKIESAFTRAQLQLSIVASFSTFDAMRAFELMQSAVESINALSASAQEMEFAGTTLSRSQVVSGQEAFKLRFEDALAPLARVDFDRALLLAERLTDKNASLMAQLAACDGETQPLTSREQGDEPKREDRARGAQTAVEVAGNCKVSSDPRIPVSQSLRGAWLLRGDQ